MLTCIIVVNGSYLDKFISCEACFVDDFPYTPEDFYIVQIMHEIIT